LCEKRSEYKALLAQQESRIAIVEKEIAEMEKKGIELTSELEKLEKAEG
jgi:hypothetical protein